MNEPIWLKRQWVDAIHFRQLQRYGGLAGVRDGNLIESALARPQNQWTYGEMRAIPMLAAVYGFGLVKNHGYVDGNKRIGFVAMAVFLDVNGWTFDADEAEVVRIIRSVADGTLPEPDFGDWVQNHSSPTGP